MGLPCCLVPYLALAAWRQSLPISRPLLLAVDWEGCPCYLAACHSVALQQCRCTCPIPLLVGGLAGCPCHLAPYPDYNSPSRSVASLGQGHPGPCPWPMDGTRGWMAQPPHMPSWLGALGPLESPKMCPRRLRFPRGGQRISCWSGCGTNSPHQRSRRRHGVSSLVARTGPRRAALQPQVPGPVQHAAANAVSAAA